jgi:hypothetical protein
MIESTSISQNVPSLEGYVQLPLPDTSIDNARERLLSFLHARTIAPITLFQNHAAAIDARQKAYEAQPFDFETGTFKPEAVEVFRSHLEEVITAEYKSGSDEVYFRYLDAGDTLDSLQRRLHSDQLRSLRRVKGRYLRSNGEFHPLKNLPDQTNQ